MSIYLTAGKSTAIGSVAPFCNALIQMSVSVISQKMNDCSDNMCFSIYFQI